MNIKEEIFRAYDIRGKYPNDLNQDIALVLGKVLGVYMSKNGFKTVFVGKDNRKSSYYVLEGLSEGLKLSGMEVYIQEGVVPTPFVNYIMCTKEYDLGLVVTASHLSNNHAGIKMCKNNALPISGTDILEFLNSISEKDFIFGDGSIKYVDFVSEYISELSSKFSFSNTKKVLLNCGNGAFSNIAPEVLENLGFEVTPIYCNKEEEFNLDGDPRSKEFVTDFVSYLSEGKFDIGIGFDSDGDRFYPISGDCKYYPIDVIGMFFSEHILKNNPGATIAFDVKCSDELEKLIIRFGGTPKMLSTGRVNFLFTIKNDQALVGMEFSGHFFFGDKYYGIDDGLYNSLRFLEILDKLGVSMDIALQKYSKKLSNEIKVTVIEDQKFSMVEKIKERALKDSTLKNLITIDGIRANVTDTGWFLVRASNTSNYLNIRIEGLERDDVTKVTNKLRDLTSDIFSF